VPVLAAVKRRQARFMVIAYLLSEEVDFVQKHLGGRGEFPKSSAF
jgi:hypothetical protein